MSYDTAVTPPDTDPKPPSLREVVREGTPRFVIGLVLIVLAVILFASVAPGLEAELARYR
jgi:hypothetical protein